MIGFKRTLHMGLVGKAHVVGGVCQVVALGQQAACAVDAQIEPVGARCYACCRFEVADKARRRHARGGCQRLHAGVGVGFGMQLRQGSSAVYGTQLR